MKGLKYIGVSLIIALGLGFSGCGSSIQHVKAPDIHKPINNDESIIQLKRIDHFIGAARKPNVVANDKLIGEIANDDELVWSAKANTFECISVESDSILLEIFVDGIKLDSTPFAYKCFFTKPKEILSLNYDFMYPSMRAVRPIAFIPIFKDINKSKATPVAIKSIISSAETESKMNLVELLKEAIKKQFKNNLADSSSKTIDLEILDYKTGNASLRWLGQSHTGSTLAKVKVTIIEDNVVTDMFITRPVISSGGFYSLNGDNYIFDEVAEDVYLHMFEPLKK